VRLLFPRLEWHPKVLVQYPFQQFQHEFDFNTSCNSFSGLLYIFSSVEAGVDTLIDSMTAFSTLAILLLLGVIAEILDTFGNSGSGGGLSIFGSPVGSSSSGSSTDFSLASAGRFG
jgi:hypothetical protein